MRTVLVVIVGLLALSKPVLSSDPKPLDLGALRAIAAEISNAMQKQDYEKVLQYDFPALSDLDWVI